MLPSEATISHATFSDTDRYAIESHADRMIWDPRGAYSVMGLLGFWLIFILCFIVPPS